MIVSFRRKLFVSLSLVVMLALTGCGASQTPSYVNTDDIDLFWQAYDRVSEVDDPDARHALFEELYVSRGSVGLQKIMRARNYTIDEYLYAIDTYPEFWTSIRSQTYDANKAQSFLNGEIDRLRTIYPSLRESRIYFTIGALRTNGTIMEGDVLIGSELAFASPDTPSDELVGDLPHLPAYFAFNPRENIGPLVLHEYVHTQQSEGGGYDLLSWSLYEGVAEYVSTAALGRPSEVPAILFGLKNNEEIRSHFSEEMFSPWLTHWLWNSPENEYGERDLGYYIGYAIAESYIDASTDKNTAIATLIEVDYQDRATVEAIVEQSGYFPQPLESLKAEFEARRPQIVDYVVQINPNEPTMATLQINFSQVMDPCCASADFGPKGQGHYPRILSLSFSDDRRSVIYNLGVEAGRDYQMLIQDNYRSERARPLVAKVVGFQVP